MDEPLKEGDWVLVRVFVSGYPSTEYTEYSLPEYLTRFVRVDRDKSHMGIVTDTHPREWESPPSDRDSYRFHLEDIRRYKPVGILGWDVIYG